jgi:hypothetical protein
MKGSGKSAAVQAPWALALSGNGTEILWSELLTTDQLQPIFTVWASHYSHPMLSIGCAVAD